MVQRIPCKKCLGKGFAKLENDMRVPCPACGGSGYEGIYKTQESYFEDEQEQKQKVIEEKNIQVTDKDKKKIIQQIIKYPEMFTTGKEFKYEEENMQIFIYLKHQNIFNISNKETGMHISLKNQYKNKLAQHIIEFLTKK